MIGELTGAHLAILISVLTLAPSVHGQPLGTVDRVPAEWEPHSATWMQWPKGIEASYREDFSSIIDALQEYEPINIVVHSAHAENQAKTFLTAQGVPLTNITWHILPYDWAWMRDNGPVWVVADGELAIEDWGFNGWSGLVPYWGDDDAVPPLIAAIEGVPCEGFDLITERGNLEFNGAGALITSWACQTLRNPGTSQDTMEALFQQAFGVSQIVWLPSAPTGDVTGGHVDGIARFIDEGTVVVPYYLDQVDEDAWLYDEAASIIENADFEVLRIDMPGYVMYSGAEMPAIYVNWLVANGVVVVPGFGVPEWDDAAKTAIESFFPDRVVIISEALELWYWGGGIHCVTNDQPSGSTTGITEGTPPTPPSAFTLERISPNPFGGSTQISFHLPQAAYVSLAIHDSSGRLVSNLLDCAMSQGTHMIVWDGTDITGKLLSAGIYYCSMAAGNDHQAGKVVLLQ